MTTANPRINIVCEAPIFNSIREIATEEHKSLSAIAHELIIEALERREDIYFSKLAERREKKSTRHLSHDEAWR